MSAPLFPFFVTSRIAAAAVLLSLTICVGSGAAVAQNQGSSSSVRLSNWSAQIEVGPSFPLAPSPFSNHYGTGVAAGLEGSAALTSSIRLEIVARYQRAAPPSGADVRALIGAPQAIDIDGAEITLIAGGAGARYEVPAFSSVRAYGALRLGAVQSRRGSVEEGSGEEVLGSSSETVPWAEAAIGARYPVSGRLSVLVGPALTAALTSERTTYNFSTKAGLQIDL